MSSSKAKLKAGDVAAVDYIPGCEACGAASMWRYVVMVENDAGQLSGVLRFACQAHLPPRPKLWLQKAGGVKPH